jgi:pimeloyl-ACP methyl ester carboxylesterase
MNLVGGVRPLPPELASYRCRRKTPSADGIEQLGGPAVIVGTSVAAGAATLVAANRPDMVDGLVSAPLFATAR